MTVPNKEDTGRRNLSVGWLSGDSVPHPPDAHAWARTCDSV